MMPETIDLLDKNPMTILRTWHEEASKSSDVKNANIFTLATASKTGRPSVRSIYMQQLCDQGLKIYTDYDSGKGKHLEENPNCSLVFTWPYNGATFWKQVIINGKAEKLDRSECLEHFKTIPLSFQIRAQFHQNDAANHPADITHKVKAYEAMFREKGRLEMPEYWGGYLIIPEEYTFFSSRPDGINLRVRFIREDQRDKELYHPGADNWVYQHMYP